MSKVKNVTKYSMLITIILVLSKMTGFIREAIVAAVLGASRQSDIFKLSSSMPNVLFSFIAAGLTTSFIPVFSDIKNDKEKSKAFFNKIINIIALICLVVAVIGIIFAKPLVIAFASGFDRSQIDIVVYYTRILMPSIVFLGVSGLYTGYLQAKGIFLQPALTGIAANFVVIIGLLVFKGYGLMPAIISVFISAIAQLLIQAPFAKEHKYEFIIDFKDQYVKRMLLLSIPTIISCIIAQLNSMVSTNFASNFGPGSISVIDYASKTSSLINQVFIVSITTVLYPTLTEKFSSGSKEEFEDTFVKSIDYVSIVAMPLTFGVSVLSKPIVQVLLERGDFDANATALTASVLSILAFLALANSYFDILGKVFFASKNTLTPMINGILSVIITVVLMFILAPKYKIEGIAIALTLAMAIIVVIMYIELKSKFKGLDTKKILFNLSKILLSAVIMSIVTKYSYDILTSINSSESKIYLLVKMSISTLLSAAVYAVSLIVLKVDTAKDVLKIFKRSK
ncbi:MAG: murein biosynthesis integral membrane protein MurJ [Clostridiales bacterium]|nr:murein biosynthesis integral membrane protein MurJ [Clostridiales bacterium]SCN23783.1 putative peptidoglycan biosynthesis protein MurJ [Clostridium sp. N3C]